MTMNPECRLKVESKRIHLTNDGLQSVRVDLRADSLVTSRTFRAVDCSFDVLMDRLGEILISRFTELTSNVAFEPPSSFGFDSCILYSANELNYLGLA